MEYKYGSMNHNFKNIIKKNEGCMQSTIEIKLNNEKMCSFKWVKLDLKMKKILFSKEMDEFKAIFWKKYESIMNYGNRIL